MSEESSPMGGMVGDVLTCEWLTWIQVRETCTGSATLSRPDTSDPLARQGQGSWEQEQMQKLPKDGKYAILSILGAHSSFAVGVYSLSRPSPINGLHVTLIVELIMYYPLSK